MIIQIGMFLANSELGMQSGPFAALDLVPFCPLCSCLHFRLPVLPLIFTSSATLPFVFPLQVSAAPGFLLFFNSVSQLWNPGSPP